ncbi:hypothetical protein GCM10007989_38200 [Devosia pacifica]|uniref:Thioredoxin domain-containing protein n=1 Tax=Devosia pacifica TaxID=1335967 RepID=A0A918VYW7_9HYPH|nr:hypothetical protein GCM10007989_38200 [Devosia pacifica]
MPIGLLALLSLAIGMFVLQAPDEKSIPASMRATSLSDLAFTNAQGEAISLAEFRGRVTLLNVWATWCAPCREEMPALDRLQQAVGSDQIKVVALSIDRTGNEAVQPFFDEINVKSLGIYLDPSMNVMEAAGVVGLPTTLLISREGIEVYRWVGPVEWDLPRTANAIRLYLENGSTSQFQSPTVN